MSSVYFEGVRNVARMEKGADLIKCELGYMKDGMTQVRLMEERKSLQLKREVYQFPIKP